MPQPTIFIYRRTFMISSRDTPTTKETTKGIAFFVFFCWYHLLKRLISDELTLKSHNRKIPDAQRQGGTAERKVLIAVASALALVQISSIYMLATGALTRGGRNPIELTQMMIHAMRIPRMEEVLNIYILYVLVAAIVVSNLLYFITYIRKASPYVRFMTAMADAGIRDTDSHIHKIWYYPARLAFIPLTGKTGEDLLKSEALWKEALFQPSLDVHELPGNEYLFVSKKIKHSSSTFLYERYAEWTEIVTDPLRRKNWQLGEYVDKDGFKWSDINDNSTLAFIGQTGSGKTESMRIFFAAAKIMHPDMRFLICDPKAAGDWDQFGPMSETGGVLKTPEDCLIALFYAKAILASRSAYCKKNGYKNITEWSQAENMSVPVLMVVVDEFPNFNKLINFDFNYKKNTTPAGILFEIMTMGRSYGVWFTLGSQFGLGEHVPPEVNKNCKVHVCLRVGSPGESSAWIDSDVAFRLGKRKQLPSGGADPESGYAYIDNVKEHVRFWFADNTVLYHEFLKHSVPTMEGHEHKAAKNLNTPRDVTKVLDALKQAGKTEKDMPSWETGMYNRYKIAKKKIEDEIDQMEKAGKREANPRLTPLTVTWNQGEEATSYAERAFKEALSRLGIEHLYTPLYPNAGSPGAPKTPSASGFPPIPPSSRPTHPPIQTNTDTPPPTSSQTATKKESVKNEPEIKRPSMDDIFKSLSGNMPKDGKK
jgi:hypothetical protein